MNQDMWLFTSDDSNSYEKMINGRKAKHIMACWFTDIDIPKRHQELILCRSYYKTPELYPKYDNYDAINVDKVADIPEDYWGVMGVPITFIDKYNPEQFEIVGAVESVGQGFSEGLWDPSSRDAHALINNMRLYSRLFIRRRRKAI